MSDSSPAAIAGAVTILTDCLDLTPGADLLLLLDETALSVVDPFFIAARQLGINLTTLFYSLEQQLRLEDLGHLDRSALESAVAAVLAHTADDAYSSFRTRLVSQWRGRTRLATMPGASAQILEIAARSNYEQMRRRCELLTPPLLNGKRCIITTYAPDGTPFVLRLEFDGIERIPVHSIGILRDNAWGNVPSGEIFTAPIETSADGEYLVNGSIGRKIIHQNDPAILTFEGGRLVGHRFLTSGEPIPNLVEIEKVSIQRGDTNWNVIAELGIGVNDGIDHVLGIPLVDEKIFGTIHIGLGNNVGWQGINKALLHLDVITWEPDVTIDSLPVLKRGRHDFDPADFDDPATYRPTQDFSWSAQTKIVKFNSDNFSLRDNRFMVKLRTQSGRVTEFPIANSRASSAARRLAKLARGQSLDLSRITEDHEIPTGQELENLLSMLWSYRVVNPD